jgi:hypothetical protein
MQAQLTAAKTLAVFLLAIGLAASFPVYSQGIDHAHTHWNVASPPPFAAGMISGAQFGAQVSAANPTFRCAGGRSFGCGAHFDPRPILAGALIGGLLSALSTPRYYPAPFVPNTGSLQHVPELSAMNSGQGGWIADAWQQFGNPRSDLSESQSDVRSNFVERWQQFFEPAR